MPNRKIKRYEYLARHEWTLYDVASINKKKETVRVLWEYGTFEVPLREVELISYEDWESHDDFEPYFFRVEEEETMNAIKATQKDLNRVIHWSSSRYNEQKKPEVVKEIIYLVEVVADTEVLYGTGSYCESGHLGGWDYVLKIEKGTATLTEKKGDPTDTVYQIEKPKTNRYFTGAKRFKVIQEKFPWHSQLIGQEFEVAEEKMDSYSFFVTLDGERVKRAIAKSLVQVIL